MASIRLQVLRAIRDALDPLFPDGRAQLWSQHGNDFSQVPTAIVRIESDTVLGFQTAHVGRVERELSIVVDISYQTPPAEELNLDESTDELLDADTMAVEAALGTVTLADIFGADNPPQLVDTVPFGSDTGQAQSGATVRAKLVYQHLIASPAEH